jgi:hypothetical protein
MTTIYPSVPAPTKDVNSLHKAFMSARQTITLLTVNAQAPSQPTLTKASQIFATTDHVAAAVSTLSNTLVNNAGIAVGNLSTQIASLQAQITALQNQMTAMGLDIADLDSRVATIESMTNHEIRVRTLSTTLNNAVANGGVLQFDTIDFDTDGFAPATTPFDHITVPAGLDGVYIFTGWSSGSGNQATTLGMGILINGVQRFPVANQSISGPASVNYVLSNAAIQTMRLAAGDVLQLVNNSVSAGANVFTGTTMSMVRIEVP